MMGRLFQRLWFLIFSKILITWKFVKYYIVQFSSKFTPNLSRPENFRPQIVLKYKRKI